MSDTYLSYVFMPDGDMVIFGAYKGEDCEVRLDKRHQESAGVRFIEADIQDRLKAAVEIAIDLLKDPKHD